MVRTQAFPAEKSGLTAVSFSLHWTVVKSFEPAPLCKVRVLAPPQHRGKAPKWKGVLLLYHHFECRALNMLKFDLKIQCFNFATGLATRKEPPTIFAFCRTAWREYWNTCLVELCRCFAGCSGGGAQHGRWLSAGETPGKFSRTGEKRKTTSMKTYKKGPRENNGNCVCSAGPLWTGCPGMYWRLWSLSGPTVQQLLNHILRRIRSTCWCWALRMFKIWCGPEFQTPVMSCKQLMRLYYHWKAW